MLFTQHPSMYGIFYLMFSTFGEFFSTTYGFSPGVGGLTYLGLGIGFALATVFGAKTADQVYQYVSDVFNWLDIYDSFITLAAFKEERRQGHTGDADACSLLWVIFRSSWIIVSHYFHLNYNLVSDQSIMYQVGTDGLRMLRFIGSCLSLDLGFLHLVSVLQVHSFLDAYLLISSGMMTTLYVTTK